MGEPDDERSWIAASQAGNPEAFEKLVARHQRMIHSLAYRMTGSMADAEDLAQETFIRVFQQLGGFRGESKFSTWLCRIAVNAALNWKAREQRRTRAHLDWAGEREIVANPPEQDCQHRQRVQEALIELKPKQRAAVVLTIYEGLSHAEAARVLGCSETTVSWRLFAARAKLKTRLRDLAPRKES
jgi:RNA polymerase sigma-70 factor (ECF subfamily)